jgi:hypothetical protein
MGSAYVIFGRTFQAYQVCLCEIIKFLWRAGPVGSSRVQSLVVWRADDLKAGTLMEVTKMDNLGNAIAYELDFDAVWVSSIEPCI